MQARYVVLATALLGFVLGGVAYKRTRPVAELVVDQLPETFDRRSSVMPASVRGRYLGVGPLSYRLNDGAWLPVETRLDHRFSIEIAGDVLNHGENVAEFSNGQAEAFARFGYDPSAIELPKLVEWSAADLAVARGRWEVIHTAGPVTTRVRPVSTAIGAERVVEVSGAFAGGRRIACHLVRRVSAAAAARADAFGILPLWVAPRSGVNAVLAGVDSRFGLGDAVGVVCRNRIGGEPVKLSTAFEASEVEPGVLHRLIVEAVPDLGADEWIVRMMCWPSDGRPAPSRWTELVIEGGKVPLDNEYGIAILAHRCLVEFGPVTIERL